MRIDFHTHILPGMDDGSRSASESLAMLREEQRQGVELVVLTPHFYANQNDPTRFLQRRREALERLQPVLTEELPQLRLGAEVHYFEGIADTEDLNRLCIEGTDLLLLEMPFSHWSDRMVRDIKTLQDSGTVRVMLAHIERYLSDQPRGLWAELRARGVLLQSNASFFASWRTRRRALSLVRRGLVQVLASDCHNMTTRVPNLERAYEALGSREALLLDHL